MGEDGREEQKWTVMDRGKWGHGSMDFLLFSCPKQHYFLIKDTRYQPSVWMGLSPFLTLFEMDIFSFAGKISHIFPSDIYI